MKKMSRGNRRYILGISLVSLMLACMSGCGSSKSSETMSAVTAESTAVSSSESKMAESYDSQSQDIAEEGEHSSSNYDVEDIPKMNTETTYDRKIIKNGEMTLQTEQFTQSIEAMIDYLQVLGGYIEESNVEGTNFYHSNNQLRTAYYKVRIPNKQFDAFVNKGGTFGIVASLNCNTQDVTSEYVDTELRIKTLQTRYDRLIALMEKTNDLTELFKLEEEIADISYEIESYKGSLNHFDLLVDMSTLVIHVQEVKADEVTEEEIPNTFWRKLQDVFSDSVEGVLILLQGIVILLVGVLPSLIIWIPIGLIVYHLIKKYRHSNKALIQHQTEKEDNIKDEIKVDDIDKKDQ